METDRKDVYLTCIRRKGHPKKHVSVCRRCRWNKSCVVYMRYRQPQLPLEAPLAEHASAKPLAFTLVSGPRGRPEPDALLNEIREALNEIRDLCS